MNKCRTVVLISGSGSNLQAILDSSLAHNSDFEVVAVISNRPGVKGLARAEKHGIPAITLDHKAYDTREGFDQALSEKIDSYKPSLIILAGFMRILTPEFVNHYLGRMLNIHPSLLPKYPGLNTHQRALEAGDSEHGTTVHFVTPELDGGPTIIQARVAIKSDDDATCLATRVLEQEHRIYPQAVRWFSAGRLKLVDGKVQFDGQWLSEPLAMEAN